MALKTIQIVLEGLLLRREKRMKDKNGEPIVPLPKKKFIMRELDLSDEERAIYDKVRLQPVRGQCM
jgi:DNA repair protein RAD5